MPVAVAVVTVHSQLVLAALEVAELVVHQLVADHLEKTTLVAAVVELLNPFGVLQAERVAMG